MFSSINTIEEKKTNEDDMKQGFISLVSEFLNIIFKLSFINFSKKNSKFTLDKTFDEYFTKKIEKDRTSFSNFICDLSDELKAIKDHIDSAPKDIDFKPKDLNLDILMSCVNNCFLYCVNDMKSEELINELKKSFHELIKRKKIISNNQAIEIISSFNSDFDDYIKYINGIKGINSVEKKLEQKKESKELQHYQERIEKLQTEISTYKNVINKKDDEIHDIKKENNELNFSLSETKLKSTLDKSTFEEIRKDFSDKFSKILVEHSREIAELHKKIQSMENEIKTLKSKLYFTEKKLESFQALVISVREDMNKLAQIGNDFSNSLDSAVDILENVKFTLDTYNNELDNLEFLFG